jgi:hypothetical protein
MIFGIFVRNPPLQRANSAKSRFLFARGKVIYYFCINKKIERDDGKQNQ